MRIARLVICALPLAAALVPLSAPLAAAEGWTTDSAQGITEYRVDNAQGDEFNISCDVEASKNGGEGTAILLTLAGKDPSPKSQLKITVDSDVLSFQVNAASMIATDCQVCSDQFKTLWAKLRTARTLRVDNAAGQSATFTLAGASTVLPPKPCKTGFAE